MKTPAFGSEQLFYWLSIAAILSAGLLWLTTIDSKATTSVQGVQDLQVQMKQDQNQFQEIRERLIRIEDKIDKQ